LYNSELFARVTPIFALFLLVIWQCTFVLVDCVTLRCASATFTPKMYRASFAACFIAAGSGEGLTDRMNATLTAVLAAFGNIACGSRGRDKAPLKNQDAFGDRQSGFDQTHGECVGVHSGEVAVAQRMGSIPRFTSWRNKLRPIVARAGLTVRRLFLNFDVAILCNRAQHLLALARKVEQGGLNG
jgi:hypothetical protein